MNINKNNVKSKERFDSIIDIIKANNGLWLNEKEYKNASSNCKVLCKFEHEFNIPSYRIIRGSWCPMCSGNLFCGEEITRSVFEEIFKCKFEKTRRLVGLRNLQGTPLEIDGFNECSRIGFEYQGKQHVEYTPHLHKNEERFFQLKMHDKLKNEYFKSNNMFLVSIPQFEIFASSYIVDHILTSLKNSNVEIPFYSLVRLLEVVSETRDEILKFPRHPKKNTSELSVSNKKTLNKHIKWDYDKAKAAVEKCTHIKQLWKSYGGAVLWMKRHDHFDELTKHFIRFERLRVSSWTSKYKIKKEAKKYTRRRDFLQKSAGAYKAAKKMNILDEVCAHMPYSGDKKIKPRFERKQLDNSSWQILEK